ncbi:MAG: HAMP domain-containing histidine kinase [Clostridiales bacterium]|nr:MAG: HAMP domain-containing histidine kinase [Clostridiales bacterium]
MTKIKLKIVLTCLCSVALILCTLLVVVNVVVPKSLENQAKKAIEQEIGENHDDEKVGHEFSEFRRFVSGNRRGERRPCVSHRNGKKAVLAFCDDKKPVRGEFYRMKDKNRDVVLAVYSSDADLTDKYEYVLYVDIKSILNYVRWLNLLFCIEVIIVGAVICAIGLKLGKTIESAQEIRQSFFQNASHELKTPLMAIQGYAEGIQTGVLPVKESAGVIMEESDRMTELIEELLALSKIDSAQAKPEFLETDVTEIIKSVANSFAPVFEKQSKRRLKTELSCEATVLCDEKQIRKSRFKSHIQRVQILQNDGDRCVQKRKR